MPLDNNTPEAEDSVAFLHSNTSEAEDSVAFLRLALDDELALMDADTIAYAPDEEIETLLRRNGIVPRGKALLAMVDAEVVPDITPEPIPTWIVPRPNLRDAVLDALAEHSVTVLAGPRGRGRSTMLRCLLHRTAAFRRYYWPQVTIDCNALKMISPIMLETEAVRALFGDDEAGCTTFLEGVDETDETPLQRYLDIRLRRNPGLLVLDHAECLALDESPDLRRWLQKLRLDCAKRGTKLLLLHGGTPSRAMRNALGEACLIDVPTISAKELAAWWSEPRFAPFRDVGIEAKEIAAVTGGVPRLVRDFGRFAEAALATGDAIPSDLARRFEVAMQGEYAPEIERILTIVGEEPRLLYECEKPGALGHHDALMASGAFGNAREDRRLIFAAPLLERRFAMYRTGSGACALIARGDMRAVIRRLARFQEATAPRLGDSLCHRGPAEAFGFINAVMTTIGGRRNTRNRFVRSILLRDATNAKLWADAKRIEAPRPLYGWQEPHKTLAIRTGRIVETDGGDVLLPVIGSRGRVAVLVTLDMSEEREKIVGAVDGFQRRLMLRRLWHATQSIQSALARAMSFHALRHERRVHREALFRLRAEPDNTKFLRDSNCVVIAQLRRSGSQWIEHSYRAISKEDDLPPLREGDMNRNDLAWLDSIHEHGRGIALDGGDLEEIFPEADADALAGLLVYMTPASGGKLLNVMVFMADSLDGQTQMTLETLSRLGRIEAWCG